MNHRPMLLLLLLLAGCGTTPRWDAQFGDTVRQARVAQIIDPAAGHRSQAPGLLDGKAAAGALKAYGESYGYTVRDSRASILQLTPGTGSGR